MNQPNIGGNCANQTAQGTTTQHDESVTAPPSSLPSLEEAKSFLRRPVVGASVTGGIVLAVGAFSGITEVVVAGAAAYAVFCVLKKRPRTSDQASA